MPIVGNVIGSASSGGATTKTVQSETPTMATFSLGNAVAVVGNTIGGGGGTPKTLILQNENGEEIPIVLVGSEIIFTANANDIREGKIAATSYGKVTGNAVIPESDYIYAYVDSETNVCLGLFAGTSSIDISNFVAISVYDVEYISKYYINGAWYEDSEGANPWESSLI